MVTEGFVAVCGVPGVIGSDDSTDFFATENELLNNVLDWNQQTLTDSLVKKTTNGSVTHQAHCNTEV